MSKLNNYLKKKLRICLLLLISMLMSISIHAQQVTVTGTVEDDLGETIPGVNVMVKGATQGTITDAFGKFTIQVNGENTTLRFSFIGYDTKEVVVGNQRNLKVVMSEAATRLDELVVIGYGTMRRKDLTGAVTSVSSKEIAAAPVMNVAQALQGKMAGVNVMSQDGRPDASVSIRIRGGGSISQSNEPLILIDGIPGSISDVPADMVASVDVLKDAASTAIYGARGANGIVLVTTKKAKEGKVSITYNGYVKFNTPTKYLETLEPYDYLAFKWALLDAYQDVDYVTPFTKLFGLGENRGSNSAGIDAYKDVPTYNQQKEVYKGSFSQNHDLTVSGGTEKTKVLFSLNYMDEDGMKLMSNNRRASASFKLDQKISNNLNFNLDVRYTDRKTLGNEGVTSGSGSLLSQSWRFRPIAVRDFKGDLSYMTHSTLGEEFHVMFDVANPVNRIKDVDNLALNQSIRGTAGLNWKIIKGLSYNTELTLTRSYSQTKNWSGPTTNDTYYVSTGTRETIDEVLYAGDADYSKNDRWSLRWSNTVNYDITLNEKHRINVVAGQEYTDSGGSDMRITGKKYPSNFTKDNAFAMINQHDPTDGNMTISSGVSTPSRVLSYFGRANYTFNDRYMFTFTMRADGSSNFSPEHRWGYFPAAALAWRVSEEAFMENTSSWLEDLKLRISYGEVGNDAISANQWSQYWASQGDARWRQILDNTIQAAYKMEADDNKRMPNRNLRWETTITRNLGIDYTLFGGRLWGTIDVYKNSTKDLLMLTNIPSITGFTQTYANIGQTSNKGVEFSINGTIFRNKDWNITAGGNINFNRGNIDKLANNISTIYGSGWFGGGNPNSDYLLKEGRAVGIVMGYKTIGRGYYETSDFHYDSSTGMYTLKDGIADISNAFVPNHGGVTPAGQNAYPGMPKFHDANGDGVIDTKDYVEIGDMMPKHTGGFNISATYKNFDLALHFNWSYGNQIYNANKLNSLYNSNKGGGLYGNRFNIVKNGYKVYDIDASGNLVRVTDPATLDALNKNATLPLTYMQVGYVSDIGIEDGSYLRLNTLSLGYTLPKSLTQKAGISNLRLYGTIYNVFILTSYTGLDPEVNTQEKMGGSGYPTPGIDWGTYPRPRQFVLGLNLTF